MCIYHALHSDVIMTLVYSNNLRLTYGCLSQFENKRCHVIARCRNLRKNLKGLTIVVYQHSKSLRFFVNANHFFFKNVQFIPLCRDTSVFYSMC